ncbi:hypothetical protein F1559_002099 [Cyanidiococcus yangmingshanensis]|uniref:Uncharacterized protein n=1 Tax=Cyanidiococcus yangmingshanensis TaxID=2690220 RepID=A0A7J7IE14_9RHOD|nr:hypothetical protein F1559_002099 [Cyanidiococcus yangmingshanensis]
MPRVSARRNYWSPRKRQEFVQSMGALSTTDPAESSELSDEDGSEEAQSEVESQDAESELPATAPFSLRRSAALVDPQNGAGTWMHTTMDALYALGSPTDARGCFRSIRTECRLRCLRLRF